MADLKEIGAFWRQKNKNGDTYYSGKVTIGEEEKTVFIFGRGKAAKKTAPDYKIFLKEEEEEEEEEEIPKGKKPSKSSKRKDEEDIPF